MPQDLPPTDVTKARAVVGKEMAICVSWFQPE